MGGGTATYILTCNNKNILYRFLDVRRRIFFLAFTSWKRLKIFAVYDFIPPCPSLLNLSSISNTTKFIIHSSYVSYPNRKVFFCVHHFVVKQYYLFIKIYFHSRRNLHFITPTCLSFQMSHKIIVSSCFIST